MSVYVDEEQAAADGIEISHRPEQSRFVVTQSRGADTSEVGMAHYSLAGGNEGDGIIDFDHTFVQPALRGTGLSQLLARRALTDDIVRGRTVHTSCWFIRDYLSSHPEVLSD